MLGACSSVMELPLRRRRDSDFESLLAAASVLPWKVGVGLAVVVFVVLHVVAQHIDPMSRPLDAKTVGAVVIPGYVHVFAAVLQFIIPLGLLIGALASFAKQRRSSEFIDSDSIRDVSSLHWSEFESLVGEVFRRRGFQVTERGGARPDGGVDLALARGHERSLVQCKQWRARQVGVSVVRELYGVMAAEHVSGGYVMTSGSFTRDAKEFAAGRNIELIDGRELSALLADLRSTAAAPIESMTPMPSALPKAPDCPSCHSPMVLRTAKRGRHTGRSFWGCSNFPRCQVIVARGN
jgi:restriction system protein